MGIQLVSAITSSLPLQTQAIVGNIALQVHVRLTFYASSISLANIYSTGNYAVTHGVAGCYCTCDYSLRGASDT